MVTVQNGANGPNGKIAQNHVAKGKKFEIENVLDLVIASATTPPLMIVTLENAPNGTNGVNGVIVTHSVTVVTGKEQDHAPALEIA